MYYVYLKLFQFIDVNILTGSNICQRHTLLFSTIGVLPEEISAYNLFLSLIFSSHVCLLFLTTLELIFFYLYNSKLHPFHRILMKEGI